MDDIVTVGVGTAFSAYLLKDGVSKLLGPTCDYLGKEMATWVEKRHRNTQKIFDIAIRRLGDRIDESGHVPPRVLRDIVNEGSWIDDSLAAEYFGGLLACARSPNDGEDISYNYLQTLKSLTGSQIRFHYILYRAAQMAMSRRISDPPENDALGSIIFIPFTDLMVSLKLARNTDVNGYFRRTTQVLSHQNIIGDFANYYGSPEFLNKMLKQDAMFSSFDPIQFPLGGGYCFSVSQYGVDLFMHAHGISSYGQRPPWAKVLPLDDIVVQLGKDVRYVRELPLLSAQAITEVSPT